MGQLVPLKEKRSALMTLMESRAGEIKKALPKHMSVERQLRVFYTAVNRTPKLLECDELSLWNCMITASELGLEPSGVQGMAYMIPYKNKKTGNYEAQFQPGYQGLMELARRSGQISTLDAYPVYDCDEFTVTMGLNPDIKHIPNWGHAHHADPKHMVGVYAVAKLKDGGIQWDYMARKEVDSIRARSKASNDGPWVTDFVAMAKKTVLKRLCKMLPKSIELQTALEYSDTADVGKSQWADDALDVSYTDETPEQETSEPEPETPAETSDLDAKIRALSDQILPAQFDDIVAAMAEKHKQKADLDNWPDGEKIGLIVELKKVAG